MYVLQNKMTGEVIDPRSANFALSPADFGADNWDELLGQNIETDLIDGYAVIEQPLGTTLYDSKTATVIRPATREEAIESANAGPEGHILVDGRKCYVA